VDEHPRSSLEVVWSGDIHKCSMREVIDLACDLNIEVGEMPRKQAVAFIIRSVESGCFSVRGKV